MQQNSLQQIYRPAGEMIFNCNGSWYMYMEKIKLYPHKNKSISYTSKINGTDVLKFEFTSHWLHAVIK